jgi:hypothetical protein
MAVTPGRLARFAAAGLLAGGAFEFVYIKAGMYEAMAVREAKNRARAEYERARYWEERTVRAAASSGSPDAQQLPSLQPTPRPP